MKRLLVVLIAVSLTLSCATAPEKKAEPLKRQIPPSESKPEEKLSLPAPPEEKKAPEELPRPSTTSPTRPLLVEETGQEKYVVINFEDADIKTVVSNISELLGINYVLSPKVSGKITVQTYRRFPLRDLFEVFQSILEMNGLTAVKEGSFYRIVPLSKGKSLTSEVRTGRTPPVSLDSGFVTQIIPIQYVKARDAANILRRLMPVGTDIIVYEPSNLLIVTARPRAILKVMKILEAVDLPPSETENIRTFVYYVENGEAKKLAQVLKEIYKPQKTQRILSQNRPRTIKVRPKKTREVPPETTIVGGIQGQLHGEISITPYEDINALIIKASPSDYLTILQTLKKLDVPSKQVLIEVLIGEVTLTDEVRYGLEWMYQRGGDFTYTIQNVNLGEVGLFGSSDQGVLPRQTSGLTGLLTGTKGATTINAILNFLASKGALNVLASPHILALDNQEAKIEIGDEIPVATGLVQQPSTTTGATTLVSTGQIQYRTAGIILTVKPHITEKGKVKLKITQEFSSPGQTYKVANQDFQGFITRRAETTGIVEDGHSLLIGGLISTKKTKTRSGIPILSDIPILGALFGTTNEETVKTELIVIVTPHIISNQEEMDRALSQFQDRVRTITRSIDEFRKRQNHNQGQSTD